MAEAMSYMAGSGTPMVLVNIMRAGPGLGGIGPSQSDYFQATKGHGHGDYRVPVLAPASIGEAMELMATAFELAERYRTPVMLVADGILGQAMEPVELRFRTPERHAFDWALTGAAGRRPGSSSRSTSIPRSSRSATWPSSTSTARSRATKSAGRAGSSRMPIWRSSPTAPPPASPGAPSTEGPRARASRSACSARSRSGHSRSASWPGSAGASTAS